MRYVTFDAAWRGPGAHEVGIHEKGNFAFRSPEFRHGLVIHRSIEPRWLCVTSSHQDIPSDDSSYPPIVIEISARVDNEVHTVRSVYSPEPAVWPKLKKPGDDAQLAKAIHQADMAFVKSLSGGSRQVSPVVGSSSAASTASGSSDAGSSNLTEAQQVATKLGCGAVYSTGNNGFAAQCSSGGVAIDCDGGMCRPTHALKN